MELLKKKKNKIIDKQN